MAKNATRKALTQIGELALLKISENPEFLRDAPDPKKDAQGFSDWVKEYIFQEPFDAYKPS